MHVWTSVKLAIAAVNGDCLPQCFKYFLWAESLLNANVTQRLAGTANIQAPISEHTRSFGMFDDPIGNAGIQVAKHSPIVYKPAALTQNNSSLNSIAENGGSGPSIPNRRWSRSTRSALFVWSNESLLKQTRHPFVE